LILLSIAELLGMAVWFSASAVVPALTEIWGLNEGGRAWLTMSVQIGFVVGAFGSAVLNLADRMPARWMFTGSAILAGLVTGLIPLLAGGVSTAVPLRFLSGVFLAGVYPVGMKIMATWTQKDRGLGIGLLVGALTVGSAAPHLLNALGGVDNWELVLYLAASLAILGGVISLLFVREGPYRTKTPPFNWKYAGAILRQRGIVLANLGYLGHMWELFAMWTWFPVFIAASFKLSGVDPLWASVWSFAVIAIGGLGSAIAGKLADRYGRPQVITASLLVSGACSLAIGWLFDGNPIALVTVGLVWGFVVVADSAQFSAAVSELAHREYIGTALTLQTSLGFLLTLITIRLIPTLQRLVGWDWAFSFLVFGPLVGIWAMARLRVYQEGTGLERKKATSTG
jgi:MFS family permease